MLATVLSIHETKAIMKAKVLFTRILLLLNIKDGVGLEEKLALGVNRVCIRTSSAPVMGA